MQRDNHNFMDIDCLARESSLFNIKAENKMLLFAIFIILIIIAEQTIFNGLMLLFIITLICVQGKTPVHLVFYYIKAPLMFSLISSIAIIFSLYREPIGVFSIKLMDIYIVITKTGLTRGIQLFAKAMAAATALLMLSLTTPIYEIIAVLRELKVPIVVTELMFLIYKYIFVMIEIKNKMEIAAESRLGYNGIKSSFYSFTRIGTNILAVAFKKSSDNYNAMLSRGYDGNLLFLYNKEVDKNESLKFLLYNSLISIILFAVFGGVLF